MLETTQNSKQPLIKHFLKKEPENQHLSICFNKICLYKKCLLIILRLIPTILTNLAWFSSKKKGENERKNNFHWNSSHFQKNLRLDMDTILKAGAEFTFSVACGRCNTHIPGLSQRITKISGLEVFVHMWSNLTTWLKPVQV